VPPIDPYKPQKVEWIIITEENYQEVFERLKKDKKDVALIGVTDDGYKALSDNMGQIQVLIRQYKAIIAAYENYYLNAENALEKAEQDQAGIKKQIQDENAARQSDSDSKFTLDKLNPFN